MKVMIVDDEPLALEHLNQIVTGFDFVSSVYAFDHPLHALEFLRYHLIDVAILDIEMFLLNGIELATQCKLICPSIKIIFLSGYSTYAVKAFKIRANGYLLKPVSENDIRDELLYVTNSVVKPPCSDIRVQTFGNFELFVNGKPVEFERIKAKEIFAYLVTKKGAYVNGDELLAVLYEDKPITSSSKSQLRTLISSLNKSLKDVNAGHIILKRRNQLAVDTTRFSCDYYEFLQGNVDAINSFMGEFMSNYEWAEFITGYLETQREKN